MTDRKPASTITIGSHIHFEAGGVKRCSVIVGRDGDEFIAQSEHELNADCPVRIGQRAVESLAALQWITEV